MDDEPGPVAMLRGSVYRTWSLFDGPGAECVGEADPSARLKELGAMTYRQAEKAASEWCASHGYHLSTLSDADDRGAVR